MIFRKCEKMKKAGARLDYNVIIGAIIIGVFVFLGIYFSGQESFDEKLIGEGLVTGVIDGDTVRVEGETLRLLGIDTEEKGEGCYFAAKKRLEELILNEEVDLEKSNRNKDHYDRYLRYIFLDGENINVQLVREGLARIMIMEENVDYREDLIEAEEYARKEGIGCLWNETEREKYNDIGIGLEDVNVEWENLDDERLEIIESCDSTNYIGEEVIVEGRVDDSFRLDMNVIFLNLDGSYPNHCFTGVIWQDYWYKFPDSPQNYYYSEYVRIKGEIEEYRGDPQIILTSPEQIEIGGKSDKEFDFE